MSRLTAKEPLVRYGLFSDEERESIGCPTSDEVYNKLKEYEDAEEQGQWVKLPCKPGDKVYAILFGLLDDPIFEVGAEFVNVHLSLQGTKIRVLFRDPQDPICHDEGIIGKDTFLTRKEAEAALEKMKDSEEELVELL